MQRRLARIAAMLFLVVLVPLAIGEIAVRLVGHYDENGDFWLRGEVIRPYHLRRVESELQEYARTPNSYLRYDADLGWSVRPGAVDETKHYHANAQGLRGARDVAPDPQPGVLRVALFGDSYIHGNEVGDDECVAAYLEQELNKRGRKAEVLNFGVPAYGMDQALLRYRRDGRQFHADVVVFGLQFENMKRNVNVFRCFLYPRRDIPFSKPRFVLSEGSLALVNSPTVAPEAIMQTLQSFATSPLAKYERFYHERDYQMRLYQHSRLLAAFADLLFKRPNPERPKGPAMELTLAIVKAFAEEARQDGAAFVMPYIPQAASMNGMRHGGHPDAALLARVTAVEPVLMPADLLAKAQGEGAAPLCVNGIGHYTPEGNRLVAHAIADAIIGQPLRH